MSKVEKELKQAIKEGRQPRCPYCHAPLAVRQVQTQCIAWNWVEDTKRYAKSEDGSSDAPYCARCQQQDWDFVSGGEASGESEKLGLDY